MATDPFAAFSAAPGEKAAADQAAQLAQGYGDLTKQYGLGRGALTTDYAAALAPWTQQGTYATQGQNALADYLGFNGPEGNARAQAQGLANQAAGAGSGPLWTGGRHRA